MDADRSFTPRSAEDWGKIAKILKQKKSKHKKTRGGKSKSFRMWVKMGHFFLTNLSPQIWSSPPLPPLQIGVFPLLCTPLSRARSMAQFESILHPWSSIPLLVAPNEFETTNKKGNTNYLSFFFSGEEITDFLRINSPFPLNSWWGNIGFSLLLDAFHSLPRFWIRSWESDSLSIFSPICPFDLFCTTKHAEAFCNYTLAQASS